MEISLDRLRDYWASTPVVLVTSQDNNGLPNVAPYGSIMVASYSEQFPCIAMGIARSQRTYRNIVEVKEFVVNIPTVKMIKIIKETSMPCPPDENKFTKFGIETNPSRKVRPPSVKGCIASFEVRLLRDIEFGGDRNLIIAEVVALSLSSPKERRIEDIKPVYANREGYYEIAFGFHFLLLFTKLSDIVRAFHK